jgi:ribosomal protein S18 acetylase RimI-like enzyme
MKSAARRSTRASKPRAIIREARAADVPELMAMMKDFNRFEGIRFRPRAMERALRDLLADRRIGVVLLARDRDGTPLGYSVLTYNYDIEFAGPDAFITELFVRADARGRGIGRALLRTLTRLSRREGLCALHLMVRPENRVARSLYQSQGFDRVPRLIMTRVLAR